MPFKYNADGSLDLWRCQHGPLSSAEAAIIILLPIAAAAIGMMIFGIEFQIVEHAV